MSLAQTIEIIPRLHAHHFLERGSEIFGVLESHPIGNIADTKLMILFGQLAGSLYADITNKRRHILACQRTQFII